MNTPYDYGDWTEDYHTCIGEYTCEIGGPLCIAANSANFGRRRAAAAAGRYQRPRLYCPTCGQVTGLAPKEAK